VVSGTKETKAEDWATRCQSIAWMKRLQEQKQTKYTNDKELIILFDM